LRCPFSEFENSENTGIISSALLLFDALFRQISIYKTTWQIDLWQLVTLLQLLHYFFDVTPGSTMCPPPVSMRTTVLQPAEEPFVTVREPWRSKLGEGRLAKCYSNTEFVITINHHIRHCSKMNICTA
jgi:hypothetical protein